MRLDYELDGGAGHRARLGLIVLHVDETVEPEFRQMIDHDGVAMYCTRIRSGTEATAESLQDMATRIPDAASLLPPGSPMDAVGYACTSGATLIGPEAVARSIREARPKNHPGRFADSGITDPLTALKAACHALGVHRPAFVSPYIAEVSSAVRNALESDGLALSTVGSFEQSEEHTVARIQPASIHEGILRVARAAPCDGVIVSCTNARTLDILADAEARLELPVISSNQALAWHMLRLAGIRDRGHGPGSLFMV
jgi:maleate isomerase